MIKSSGTLRWADNRRLRLVLLVALLALSLLSGASTAWAAQPADESTVSPAATPVPVRLEPVSFSFGTCETTMNVRVYDVADLYGVEYRITFDPTKLQVTDANRDLPGVQIGTGGLFQARRLFEINSVNNSTGVIDYAATITQGGAPVAGTGGLGQITFRVVKPGANSIQFVPAECLLAKPAGVGDPAIPATWHNATPTATGSCPQILLPLVAKRHVSGS
jgi:hypothetical protein